MKEGELLYFTQAELEVMLDLSHGTQHTLYRTGPPPDDAALTEALVSLYQRGFLLRTPDTLAPAPKGSFFRQMGAAPLAVTLETSRPRPATALCYADGEALWLCEHIRTQVSERVRVRQLPAEHLERWLYEADILEPPFLTDADARELSALREELGPDGPGTVRLRLECRRNGGAPLGVYEVLDGNGLALLRSREGAAEKIELYTLEALRAMLARCFRKDCQEE